MQDGYTAVASH